MGKGGRALVEVFHINQHGGGNPLRGGCLIVEFLLQALKNQSQPARLDCGGGAVFPGFRQARPSEFGCQYFRKELSVRRT